MDTNLTLATSVKFLKADGTGPYSGFAWPLPSGDRPGDWVEVPGALIPCEVGLHYTTLAHWRDWRDARLFAIETDGEVLDAGDKLVCRRARLTREITAWNPATLRVFACDCAERVVPLFERHHPHDTRPREAIAVARRFAHGAASLAELDAAGDAARAAAGAAARAAAFDAAWDAAWAAWAAAWDAESAWQDARLLLMLNQGAL